MARKHQGFLAHAGYRWLWVGLAASAFATLGYREFDVSPRPIGGSWYGYVLGVVGALLILWLTALGLRKRAFSASGSPLRAWVSAHVYLGLALLVIVTLHTGFRFGWDIHTLAYALMVAVIGSGAVGILSYTVLPRRMSDNRAEHTQAQMLARIRDIDLRLDAAAQRLGNRDAGVARLSLEHTRLGGSLPRRLGFGRGGCGNHRALALLNARPADGDLQVATVVELLFQKEAALDRVRRHLRLAALMDLWLRVHVPLTFALIAALLAHIVSVFFYW